MALAKVMLCISSMYFILSDIHAVATITVDPECSIKPLPETSKNNINHHNGVPINTIGLMTGCS